jgi:hypothetical protein
MTRDTTADFSTAFQTKRAGGIGFVKRKFSVKLESLCLIILDEGWQGYLLCHDRSVSKLPQDHPICKQRKLSGYAQRRIAA